ncbi:MAG: ABC transporter permease subunit [Kiritimatiellae bacterium]|nr:ABC transporter permease subunit [Kiritimatiellia bacterium]
MGSFWRIFSLELKALWRGRTAPLVALAAAAWTCLCPYLVHGDGTTAGAEEMILRYTLGGAAAIVTVSLLIAGADSIARERETRRLQLTLIKPVGRWAVALARMAALSAVATALIMGSAALYAALARCGRASELFGQNCAHVYRPVLPSPQAEAEVMYNLYMADAATPKAVKEAPRKVVLRLLAQRARDRYDTIGTNETAVWKFALPPETLDAAVRLKFTNLYDQRRTVEGFLAFGAATGAVRNVTRASSVFALHGVPGGDELRFVNCGTDAVMLRPRQDVEVLLAADGFAANLVRAALELSAIATLLVAFAVMLSAFLGRPVAVFVAVASLALAEMSPSVLEQYPDELEKDRVDAIGLCLTRMTAELARPVSALSPVEKLASGECVEWSETARALFTHMVLAPALMALLAGLALPRKNF